MASFQAKIEDLTGSIGDVDAISQWLTDGAKEIINLLPPELKIKASTRFTLNTSTPTLDLDNADGTGGNLRGEMLYVARLSANSGGFQKVCREIPGMFGDLTNDSTDLMYYATVTDPVYFITNNSSGNPTLFVKPSPTDAQPAYVHAIKYPVVAYGGAGIANFPDEAEYLVVLYAAIKGLHRLMNDMTGDLPNLALPVLAEASSAPTAPSLSTVSYVDALDATVVTVDKADISGNAPTYTKNVISPDFADANTWLNTEEDSELVSSRVQIISAQLQEYQLNVQNELNEYNKENSIYQANIQAELAKHNTNLQKAIADAQNDQSTELQNKTKNMEALIQDNNTKISKYSQEINSYSMSINKEVQRYQSEVAAKVQDFQVVLEKYSINYQWYQSQYAQLKQDYNQGLSMLVGASLPQPPKKQQGER